MLVTVLVHSGCSLAQRIPPGPHDTTTSYHDRVGLQIEYPQVSACTENSPPEATGATEPLAFEDPSELPAWDLTLEEAVRLAVGNSPALRTLGGAVVTSPQATTTVYDPALAHANPQLGVEAALSAFDAQYSGQLYWTKVDQPTNVQRGGLGAAFNPVALQETNAVFTNELAKQTAQGAGFALRHVVNYNRTNRPFRQFPSDFIGFVEAEWRQPLMQGAGTYYNQIAGPNAPIGQYNGVLIARINEDVSLADFEAAVITLVADVEQAYWELYEGYRLLEANLRGREAALQTFQFQETRLEAGIASPDEEAQARSQFFQFHAQVQNTLAGPSGLYAAEQRLRYLLGLPATDGRLIKPVSRPATAEVVFDWNSALNQALSRRVEIRRQKWNIKRRELELVASRLNRRPRLDFLGQYRWRGLGDHLIGDNDGQPLDNLYGSITGGDYQEWQAGLELSFPVGLRAASNAVAHARLNVARERALLNETELRVSHDLSAAARELQRAHTLLETNYHRYQADLRQMEVLLQRYVQELDNINFYLQAQRQVLQSESDFYRAITAYNLAIRELHRQKGTLLAYNHVALNEGPWAAGAMNDAYQRGRFFKARQNPGAVEMTPPVSAGPFDPSQPAPQTAALDAVPEFILDQRPVVTAGPARLPEVESEVQTSRPAANPAAANPAAAVDQGPVTFAPSPMLNSAVGHRPGADPAATVQPPPAALPPAAAGDGEAESSVSLKRLLERYR
ncbi:TolC family protein [Roseimaritima sediminicola]|uniref:TolC family protein n=1 Tax=Roseimaritima sediminicola TaxID=2662066 RepID=UPI00129832AA|nr:TolC family protein [Roseimaritima sediminicola]